MSADKMDWRFAMLRRAVDTGQPLEEVVEEFRVLMPARKYDQITVPEAGALEGGFPFTARQIYNAFFEHFDTGRADGFPHVCSCGCRFRSEEKFINHQITGNIK